MLITKVVHQWLIQQKMDAKSLMKFHSWQELGLQWRWNPPRVCKFHSMEFMRTEVAFSRARPCFTRIILWLEWAFLSWMILCKRDTSVTLFYTLWCTYIIYGLFFHRGCWGCCQWQDLNMKKAIYWQPSITFFLESVIQKRTVTFQ